MICGGCLDRTVYIIEDEKLRDVVEENFGVVRGRVGHEYEACSC